MKLFSTLITLTQMNLLKKLLICGWLLAPVAFLHASTTQVVPGRAVMFTVSSDGTSPFSYQWKKNGVNIIGATGTSITLPAVGIADAGSYTVLVSNSAGSVLSDTAIITVVIAPTNAIITITVSG